MEETGTILSVEGLEIVVQFDRTEACKKCGACNHGQDGQMIMRMSNPIGGQVGEHITVELEERTLLVASLLAYGLPLLGLLLGLFAGQIIAPYLPGINKDLLSVLAAILLTFAAFMINRAFEPMRKRKGTYLPKPIRIQKEKMEDEPHVQ